MRDLVSERRRGRYFAYRTRLTTIATFVSLVACGLILHELDTAGRTYLGFVVIFLIIGRPAAELEERAPALEKRDNGTAPADPTRNADE